jgi:hypothetical protein
MLKVGFLVLVMAEKGGGGPNGPCLDLGWPREGERFCKEHCPDHTEWFDAWNRVLSGGGDPARRPRRESTSAITGDCRQDVILLVWPSHSISCVENQMTPVVAQGRIRDNPWRATASDL